MRQRGKERRGERGEPNTLPPTRAKKGLAPTHIYPNHPHTQKDGFPHANVAHTMTLPPGRYANFGGGKRAKNFLSDVGKRTVEKGGGGSQQSCIRTDEGEGGRGQREKKGSCVITLKACLRKRRRGNRRYHLAVRNSSRRRGGKERRIGEGMCCCLRCLFSLVPCHRPLLFLCLSVAFPRRFFSLFLLPMGKRRGGEGENPLPPPSSGEREILSLPSSSSSIPISTFDTVQEEEEEEEEISFLFPFFFPREMKQEELVRPIGSRVSVQYRNRRRKGKLFLIALRQDGLLLLLPPPPPPRLD